MKFETVGNVIQALKAYRDYYETRSASVVAIGRTTRDIDADPFRRGFLDSVQLRTELLTRLSALDERERSVVLHWYVNDLPVPEICKRMSLSRASAYRLRDRALHAMVAATKAEEVVAATA